MLGLVFRVVLAGYALYRTVKLVSIEDGPLDLFDRIRRRLGGYDLTLDERPERVSFGMQRPKSQLGRIITCPYCLGIWLSPFFSLLAIQTYKLSSLDFCLITIGIAGIQASLQSKDFNHG